MHTMTHNQIKQITHSNTGCRPSGSITSGTIVLLLGLIGPASLPALSEQPPADTNRAVQDQGPIYTPPKKFSPRARVGGQLRGTEGKDPEVVAIVPDHVGITSSNMPVLNWFLSKETSKEVRFTLIDDKSVRPLYEAPIPTPKHPGIYSVQMKDLNLKLEPGVQYRWYVSVIRDPESPSKDIVGGGVIEHCEMSECLIIHDVKITCSVENVNANAHAGVWYDAMGCLCTLIDANPADANLRRLRARLLKDVGLNGVADWDLRSVQAQQR